MFWGNWTFPETVSWDTSLYAWWRLWRTLKMHFVTWNTLLAFETLLVFNVRGPVHRKYIPVYIQQNATLHSLCLKTVLHVSGGTSAHHQELIQLYLHYLVEHVGQLSDINKLCKVASCWICIGVCFQCIRHSNLVCLHCMFECFPAVPSTFWSYFQAVAQGKTGSNCRRIRDPYYVWSIFCFTFNVQQYTLVKEWRISAIYAQGDTRN
jgi:hypothetical protein